MKDSISRGGNNRYEYNSSVKSEAAVNKKAPVQKKRNSSIQFSQNKEGNSTQQKEDSISKFHALKAANEASITQKKEHEEEELQLKRDEWATEPTQQKEEDEKIQLKETATSQPNHTGLPDNLKAGVENLSGLSLDHVKVNYNSNQPAQLHAHAFAQGSEIHVAPGQEKHLPHEAWHVVQQMQGRVKPNANLEPGPDARQDPSLAKQPLQRQAISNPQLQDKSDNQNFSGQSSVVQRVLDQEVVTEILENKRAKLTVTDFESHTEISETTLGDVLSDVSCDELNVYDNDKAFRVYTKLRGYPNTDNKFLFDNYFSEKVWVMGSNFKSLKLTDVNLNEVVAWQADKAGCDGKPEYIVRHNIVNEVARKEANEAREKHGEQLVELDTDEGKIFINDTDNGRSTVRILQERGLRPLSMQVVGSQGDPTVIIKTEPGEWKLPPRTNREKVQVTEKIQDDFLTKNMDGPMIGELTKVSAKKKSSKNGSSEKRKCFLTTACVTARGLPDDCYELTTLRAFRDGYMSSLEDGPEMIEEYYRVAPQIVDAIHADPAADAIMNDIYAIILDCIGHIESNRPETTLMIYRSMVLGLAGKYSI